MASFPLHTLTPIVQLGQPYSRLHKKEDQLTSNLLSSVANIGFSSRWTPSNLSERMQMQVTKKQKKQ